MSALTKTQQRRIWKARDKLLEAKEIFTNTIEELRNESDDSSLTLDQIREFTSAINHIDEAWDLANFFA